MEKFFPEIIPQNEPLNLILEQYSILIELGINSDTSINILDFFYGWFLKEKIYKNF